MSNSKGKAGGHDMCTASLGLTHQIPQACHHTAWWCDPICSRCLLLLPAQAGSLCRSPTHKIQPTQSQCGLAEHGVEAMLNSKLNERPQQACARISLTLHNPLAENNSDSVSCHRAGTAYVAPIATTAAAATAIATATATHC